MVHWVEFAPVCLSAARIEFPVQVRLKAVMSASMLQEVMVLKMVVTKIDVVQLQLVIHKVEFDPVCLSVARIEFPVQVRLKAVISASMLRKVMVLEMVVTKVDVAGLMVVQLQLVIHWVEFDLVCLSLARIPYTLHMYDMLQIVPLLIVPHRNVPN